MKSIFFRKSAIIFSVAAAIGCGIALACADGWFYYDYNSDFTPEVFVDKSYAPLLFAPDETFYGNAFDTDYNGRFNESALKDWSVYLGPLVPEKQLAFLLLNDSASSVIPVLYESAKAKTKAPKPFETLALTNPKIKSFLEFLHYAKTIEKSSVAAADPWDYSEENRAVVPVTVRSTVERLYNEARDPFLKNRFWFQTMKAHFYGADKKSILPFFEKTKSLQPRNSLYYRGVSYVAGVHYRQKNFATANYLYGVVFDEFPALRQVAAYNFHPQEDADFNAALALAPDKKAKAALWAMLGFYGDEFAAVEQIYALDPSSEHLSYLLTRVINKLEASVNTGRFASSADYKKAMRNAVSTKMLQVVEQIANSGNTVRPDLWLISAGYLNTFAGNYGQAIRYFDKAEQIATQDEEVKRQLHVLRLITTICSLNKIDEAAEKMLLPELQWLHNRCGSAGEEFRCSHVINWSSEYISRLYAEATNPIMAEVLDRNQSFYRDPANLQSMKAFLQAPAKSDWQRHFLKRYPISIKDIQQYEAIMFAYAGDLDNSIKNLELSGKNADLLGNPFNGKIKDCHDCDHAAPQKVAYTSLLMLQKMKEMQAHVDSGNDIYNNSMLLANAYYNMTYHGNARKFYENEILNQYGNSIDPFYHPQLLNCDRARAYYQKAFDAATTPEQKAKCVYMMAKCDRNDYYSATVYAGDYNKFDETFVSWKNFKTLKEEYANTRYYQEVIKECGYFKEYVQK